MPLRVLELGRFSVVSTTEALKLEVVSGADITGPPSLADLDDDALVKVVTSRQLWVSRGRGCRIDIEVLLDGKRLDRNIYFQLLERLGCQIRDAKPWNQLSLSASLEFFPDMPSVRVPHLSIHLNNSTKPPEHEEGFAAWIGNIDVNPPPGVVCAQLDRLQIQFNLMPSKEGVSASAPAPSPLLRPESLDIMLLDLPLDTLPTPMQDADSVNLEQAVEILKSLPSQVANCFGLSDPDLFDDERLLKDSSASRDRKSYRKNETVSLSAPHESDSEKAKSNKRISEKARGVLDAWVDAHRDNLYPTMEEKEQLVVATGLKRRQLNTQLFCYRQRLKKDLASDAKMESKEDLLADGPVRGVEWDGGWENDEVLLNDTVSRTGVEENDEEMLFSQSSNEATPSLSQSSTITAKSSTGSTIAPTDSNCTSLARKGLPWDLSPITIASSSTLVDVAFRALMGAALPRRRPTLQTLHFKSPPEVTMSTFVPSMFSLGFKNSIAGHSRFLPTISHALSASMPQNIQTPSLRRKLLQLSNLGPSQFPDPNSHAGHPGTGERLSSVVQSRLWSMMQRKLFETAAGQRNWRPSTQGDGDEESDFEDMLATIEDEPQFKIDGDDGISDDEMLFADDENDDLLLSDEYDHFNADWQRHAIEDEIEDMLLGDDWPQHLADSHEEMMLEYSSVGMQTSEGDGNITLQEESENEMLLDYIDKVILKKVDGEISILLLDESENEEMLI
ncbi:hypothetical protein DL98DRAFT_570905 [Cadophora sp. DSE1049]|nr:hypothetical protein DL98DRAFT_570905 [Cadophora sp. DSE1049]